MNIFHACYNDPRVYINTIAQLSNEVKRREDKYYIRVRCCLKETRKESNAKGPRLQESCHSSTQAHTITTHSQASRRVKLFHTHSEHTP